MEEFRVSKFITLKLENGSTVIYVKNEEFMQCKSLLLNIPIEEMQFSDDIGSVDDAAEVLMWSENEEDIMEYKLSPELEFWGHCSNIQGWVEHDYDTRLMHSNLAFPLLKKLTDVGDPNAKKVFKLEILRRFIEGTEITKEFLIENKYIDYLTEDDARSILPVEEVLALESIEECLKIRFQLAEYLKIITEPGDWVDNYYYIEDYRIIGLKVRTSKVESVPEAIGKLNRLRYLKLSYNSFKNLPESIGELDVLEMLSLNGNKFESIPESVKNLKKLRILNLSYNKLKEVPLLINCLDSLEILYLDRNPISNLPRVIGNLKKDLKTNKYRKKNKRQEKLIV